MLSVLSSSVVMTRQRGGGDGDRRRSQFLLKLAI
jgi:hypothetical protein